MSNAITFSMFCDLWEKSSRSDSFSYEGKQALYEYLIESGTSDNNLTDIVALDCQFAEYDSARELAENYDGEALQAAKDFYWKNQDDDALDEFIFEWFQNRTTILRTATATLVINTEF